MTDLSTDARLVTDFLAGDKSALAAIYDRYASGLYDTAAAMLSDRHDAADMVQDVFCIAAERLSQLREPDRLKPWLYSVLRHEVYRRTKKRKRATPVDFQDEGTPDVASGYDPHAAGETVAYEELATLVRSAASGLDERDRLVLELSVRQGLSGADLADALGVTPEQSYSLVHRMRDRVEKSLGALTVAKAGRRDCAPLAQILEGWNGELTILLRKRVNRHIEDCATCERTRTKFAPLALFGAAPVFAMPFGLRDKVLAAALPGGGSGGSGPSTSHDSSTSHGSSNRGGSRRQRDIRFDAHKGFPKAVRAGRHVALWASTAAIVAVVGGGLVVATSGDDDAAPLSGDTTAVVRDDTSSDSTTVAPSDGSSPSTISTTNTPSTPTSAASTRPSTVDTTTPNDANVGGAGGPAAPPTTTVVAVPTPVIPPTTTPQTTSPTPNASPSTTEGAKTSPSSTTAAPFAVQSIGVSNTKFDFGTTGSVIKVVLSNPNTFPVSYTTAVTSAKFSPSPASGTLGAGEQVSFTVTFDRAGAVADTTGFPTGSFTHSLTFTTSATGGSSSPTRTATMYGSIQRPTTTTAAPTTATVGKVTGSLQNCVALSASATVTGKIVSVSVTATFRRLNMLTNKWTDLATTPSFTMSPGANGTWTIGNVKVQPPSGTQNVLLRVTATPSAGTPVSATGSFSQTC